MYYNIFSVIALLVNNVDLLEKLRIITISWLRLKIDPVSSKYNFTIGESLALLKSLRRTLEILEMKFGINPVKFKSR